MPETRRSGTGLAGRIVRVTVLVGAFTVLTASAVAIIGASRLAAEQFAARDQSSLQLVQDEIADHVLSVEKFASGVAESVASTSSQAAVSTSINDLIQQSEGAVQTAVLADRSGEIVSAVPTSASSFSPMTSAAFRDALAGNTGFRRISNPNGTWSLWLTRTVLTPSGRPQVLLVGANSGFLAQTLAAAAGDRKRVASLVENGRPLVSSSSEDPPLLAQAQWQSDSGGSGRVYATSAKGARVIGHYSEVRGIQGLELRVAVVAPSNQVTAQTFAAVAPTLLVLVLGGLLGIAAALFISRRLTRPLKTLEKTARAAAAGAIVNPVPETSDDEIGRVAAAFNAVALRLNALHDLSQLLASTSQLDQVLDGILSAMAHIVGPGVGVVYLLDDDGEWLMPARARGVDAERVRRVRAGGDGWLARALSSTDVLVQTAEEHELRANIPGLARGDHLVLTAPLVSGRETLGIIIALRPAGERITDAECEMVRTFSAQAAIAVENSRLFEAETESLRVAEALRMVADRFVRPGGLAEALADVEEVVTDLFDAETAFFAVVDRAALSLPAAEDHDQEALLLLVSRRLFASHGMRAMVVHRGEDPGADQVLEQLASLAMLIAPVAFDSDHGAVMVVSLTRSGIPSHDLDLAEAVANETSLALENAYLFQRALSRAANLETVFRISQAVGSSLQVNVVLNRVLDVVQKILSADAVALMTYDARKRRIATAMARGDVPSEVVTLELLPGEDLAGYVFATGEPAAFRELDVQSAGIGGQAARQGFHSLLAVPLLTRGRSIGVLMVFTREPGAFTDEDMNVLQTFAAQAAQALDTARLYSREHEVASILQTSILPDALPDFPEISSASAYQPAGMEAEIGGDYYDLFRGPEGRIWFTIGDVCGKGVVAATKTSMIKYSVRAFVAAGLRPAYVLAEINRIVAETGDASDIVTLWVGMLDPKTGVLTYASGGHPPAMVRREDASIERTRPTGPLLGALIDVAYGEESVLLKDRDVVLLYTDGVTEARSERVFFGESRVQEALEAGGSATEIVQRLLTSVRRWTRGELRDDVAVLAIALGLNEREHDAAHTGEARG
jgi:serine phosphatase RsbU (regulator of sigma subunit)/HAMP domain-containing protein